MSDLSPTPPRWRDLVLEEKSDHRTALAVCGLSNSQFADMCGVTDDVAEAWGDPNRSNQVPAAIDRCERVPRAYVEFMRTARDRRRGERYLAATTPEEQSAVVMLRMGQTITVVAPTLNAERLGREIAAQQIVVGESLVTAVLAWLAQLRRRVVTRSHVAAGRGS